MAMNANLNVASTKMSAMLCCSGEKDSAGRDLKSAQNTPSRQPMQPPYTMGAGQFTAAGQPQFRPQIMQQQQQPQQMQYGMNAAQLRPMQMNQNMNSYGHMPPTGMMGGGPKDDYRKGTGISEEVFRQIETVQNRYDSSTAAAFRAVQKSGEMVVRTLDPRQFIRLASETAPKINIDTNDPDSMTSFVEIVKRPGQTLGLYIREGNGMDRSDGVFISRIAPESSIYNSGCLQISDEILAVNLVDVTRMSLDDVVIIMSIPRRLVLTTRRAAINSRYMGPGGAGPMGPMGPGRLNGDGAKPGVVVYKGQNNYGGGYDSMDSPGRRGNDYNNMGGYPPRDTRTLTWDRNPKPDRNDPKYFPVNSLPRHPGNAHQRLPNAMNSPGMAIEEAGMPPPMRELNTAAPNWGAGGVGPTVPPNDYPPVSSVGGPPGDYYSSGAEGEQVPGRGQRLLHRMAQDRYGSGYSTLQYQRQYPRSNGGMMSSGASRNRHYSGMDYASDTEALQSPVLSVRGMRTGMGGRSQGSRTNSLPRTFQREALLRHPELSMEMDRLASPGLAPLGPDDPMSDSGIISAPENIHSIRNKRAGYRSPSSLSAMGGGDPRGANYNNGYKDLRRTPSTSAIYETLRRSKELRESLSSRPSSRLSLRGDSTASLQPFQDAQYFSDSEHQMVSGSWSQHRGLGGGQDMQRRMRNRTLTGLESMRMGGGMDHLRPSSAQSRPITPSFSNDKDPGQTFIDFNPADFIKYKSECDPEASAIRLSGILSLHLLSGRGLRTGGRSRRIRDLYCVVEVDHIHKARTVVRSGGVNFDWDEKFELDLANNLEVEFLVYSWDPQLRHRLCYRSSLRLSALFGKGQTFQQVALRLHPAGTLYLTLRFTDLREAYDRSRHPLPGISPVVVPQGLVRAGVVGSKTLFGCSLETVLDREASGFPVPLIVKRCTDEVEKRGLDIIGIYRLCGSETKKQMLREAFEESPELVDLSSENVPDINVITGLLKEYLRELPEPVFSNCLYQMLVDAMGVFLPDDPDGNAKLVFSILDCLPKANRNCLVHIMDHLSKVTGQCSRNKMNPQNLAICFAPVLMMDFSSQSQSVQPVSNISEPIQILKYLIEIWPKNNQEVL